MAWPSDERSGDGRALPDEALEFRYYSGEPIALGDLAQSFAAIDRMFALVSHQGERLTVSEVRQGSIIGVFAPFFPQTGQILPYLSDGLAILEFSKRLRKAVRAFVNLDEPHLPEVIGRDPVADELAAVVRPLIGKKGSGLKAARVHYRSRTDRRTVEVVVSLGHDQIVKIGERAGWPELEPPSAAPAEVGGEFLRNVDIILHQANRGPAKARGQTGDRGIIPSVNDKPVPVYFADGVNRLKDRMIRSAKNPLKYIYRVDAWVQREGGEVRSYTVTEVHKATPMKDERSG